MKHQIEVDEQGNRFWYNEQGQLHRTDGPAVEYADGDREWWVNDQRHRLDGPAVEYVNGHRYWYINGKCLAEKEFLAWTQLPSDKAEQDVKITDPVKLQQINTILLNALLTAEAHLHAHGKPIDPAITAAIKAAQK